MTFLGRLGLRRVAGRDAPDASREHAPADAEHHSAAAGGSGYLSGGRAQQL